MPLTKLSNGLRVVTDPMPGVETVSLGAWVEAGTRFEGRTHAGISHFLEHMFFKGTQRRSAAQIAEEIEEVGGQINAYTSRDHTAFYAKVLAGDRALATDVLSDMLVASTFSEDELVREQEVVVQEIHQAHDTPDDIVFDHLQTAAFGDQPLGRPVLGTEDSVRAFSRADLMSYVAGQYTAPNMVVAASGRVDHDEFAKEVELAFADVPPGAPNRPDPARYLGGNARDERALEQAHVVLGFDGEHYQSPDFYGFSVLSVLLGEGMSSRLFQEVREKRGLAYSVFSAATSFTDCGLFSIYAGTSDSLVPELSDVICAELRKAADGLTEAEVNRAKVQLRAGILMSLESTSARCTQAARQTLVYGAPQPVEEILEEIAAVDAASVRTIAQRIFGSAPSVAGVGHLGGLPEAGEIADRLS